jgi:hypothetical protein
MAVLVAYERDQAQLRPLATLQAWLAAADGGALELAHILLYDNSATPRARPAAIDERISYLHNPANGGTAAAYAYAATLAASRECAWLLLLDHDTEVPRDLLQSAALALPGGGATSAALLPRAVNQKGRFISPAIVTRFGGFRPLNAGEMPATGHPLTAIASGCVLSVAALREILPFPDGMWLDFVDHWIFAQLRARGHCFALFESTLQQDLSIANPERVSWPRMRSILSSERRFQHSLGSSARRVYPWRVAWRIARLACLNPRLAWHAIIWLARN